MVFLAWATVCSATEPVALRSVRANSGVASSSLLHEITNAKAKAIKYINFL